MGIVVENTEIENFIEVQIDVVCRKIKKVLTLVFIHSYVVKEVYLNVFVLIEVEIVEKVVYEVVEIEKIVRKVNFVNETINEELVLLYVSDMVEQVIVRIEVV